jgi:GNAT superfamily N-acetyltransferase
VITRPRPAVHPADQVHPADAVHPADPVRAAGPARAPWIRPARATDRPLLEAMHRRCSPASRYSRWHAPLPTIPESYLAGALSGAADHIALVAVTLAGEMIAVASAVRHDDAWELGILVEDRYQRRGLGSALLTALLNAIPADRPARLQIDLLAERAGLLRPLGRLGRVRVDWQDEVVHARIELRR